VGRRLQSPRPIAAHDIQVSHSDLFVICNYSFSPFRHTSAASAFEGRFMQAENIKFGSSYLIYSTPFMRTVHQVVGTATEACTGVSGESSSQPERRREQQSANQRLLQELQQLRAVPAAADCQRHQEDSLTTCLFSPERGTT